MSEPKWLTKQVVNAVHEGLVAEHGGLNGIREEGLLESALARPRHAAVYGSPSLFELAASYAYGIAKNHPFLDGNKRTALMAAYIFLGRNGLRLAAPEVEAVGVFRDLAAGEIGEAEVAGWLEANAVAWES